MLKITEVLKSFSIYLSKDESSYADSFNSDIYRVLGLDDDNHFELKAFFEKFNNAEEIISWLELVKSAIVMHEDDEGNIDEIIYDYIESFKKSEC
jgi:hypothetical protein